MFLGRISYGHTIRKALTIQFILPALFNILWMVIFGGAAVYMQLHGGQLVEAMQAGPEYAVYAFLSQYPIAALTIPVFLFCMFLSYVTGSDAYTTTLGGMSTTGISPKSPEPPMLIKIFWGMLIGLVAWIMVSTTGVNGVKMLSNLGGAPALLLEILICVALVKVSINPKAYDVRKQDYTDDGIPIKSIAKKSLMTEDAVFESYSSEEHSQ